MDGDCTSLPLYFFFQDQLIYSSFIIIIILSVHYFLNLLFILHCNGSRHIESESTMFGTVMNYVAMRLLGVRRSDPRIIKARDWIKGEINSIPNFVTFLLLSFSLIFL